MHINECKLYKYMMYMLAHLYLNVYVLVYTCLCGMYSLGPVWTLPSGHQIEETIPGVASVLTLPQRKPDISGSTPGGH